MLNSLCNVRSLCFTCVFYLFFWARFMLFFAANNKRARERELNLHASGTRALVALSLVHSTAATTTTIWTIMADFLTSSSTQLCATVVVSWKKLLHSAPPDETRAIFEAQTTPASLAPSPSYSVCVCCSLWIQRLKNMFFLLCAS